MGDVVSGPEAALAICLAKITLSGRDLADARALMAEVLREPPVVQPVDTSCGTVTRRGEMTAGDPITRFANTEARVSAGGCGPMRWLSVVPPMVGGTTPGRVRGRTSPSPPG